MQIRSLQRPAPHPPPPARQRPRRAMASRRFPLPLRRPAPHGDDAGRPRSSADARMRHWRYAPSRVSDQEGRRGRKGQSPQLPGAGARRSVGARPGRDQRKAALPGPQHGHRHTTGCSPDPDGLAARGRGSSAPDRSRPAVRRSRPAGEPVGQQESRVRRVVDLAERDLAARRMDDIAGTEGIGLPAPPGGPRRARPAPSR